MCGDHCQHRGDGDHPNLGRRSFLRIVAGAGAATLLDPTAALAGSDAVRTTGDYGVPPSKPTAYFGPVISSGAQVPNAGYRLPPHKPSDIMDRRLLLLNENTSERLATIYNRAGRYVIDALHDLNWLLRDHHVDQAVRMDPHLYDILEAVQLRFSPHRPIVITSGYRSEITNRRLSRSNRRVAGNSLHCDGKAVDLQVAGVSNHTLRRYLESMRGRLKIGGVGLYDTHVHVDTGPRRTWLG